MTVNIRWIKRYLRKNNQPLKLTQNIYASHDSKQMNPTHQSCTPSYAITAITILFDLSNVLDKKISTMDTLSSHSGNHKFKNKLNEKPNRWKFCKEVSW